MNELKEKGNDLFRSSDNREASKLYTQALKECPSQLTTVKSMLYNNRAAAKVKMVGTKLLGSFGIIDASWFTFQERKESALKDCTKAIELNPVYVKALLRRAKLYEELDQLDKALADYKELHNLEPKNPEVNFALNTLPQRIQEQNEKLKQEMLGLISSSQKIVLPPLTPLCCNREVERLGECVSKAFWTFNRQLPAETGPDHRILLRQHDEIKRPFFQMALL